jgi:hypothetical protein
MTAANGLAATGPLDPRRLSGFPRPRPIAGNPLATGGCNCALRNGLSSSDPSVGPSPDPCHGLTCDSHWQTGRCVMRSCSGNFSFRLKSQTFRTGRGTCASAHALLYVFLRNTCVNNAAAAGSQPSQRDRHGRKRGHNPLPKRSHPNRPRSDLESRGLTSFPLFRGFLRTSFPEQVFGDTT